VKQEVGKAAAVRVKSGSIVGLGTGSTTAYTIQFLSVASNPARLKILLCPPFQAEVLAKQYGIL